MRLSDRDIKSRLTELPALPSNHLQLISEGKIPIELESLLRNKRIVVDPLPDEKLLGPVTIDIHLGYLVEMEIEPLEICMVDGKKVIRHARYDPTAKNGTVLLEREQRVHYVENGTHTRFYLAENEYFELGSGQFIVAHSFEKFYVPTDLVMWLDGRSRFSRHGVSVHISQPRFDPSWCGPLAFEILNAGKAPVILSPHLRFAAVNFELLSSPCETPYFARQDAKFRGQIY